MDETKQVIKKNYFNGFSVVILSRLVVFSYTHMHAQAHAYTVIFCKTY